MKRYLFCTAIAAMALTSCSNDDFLGEVPGNNPNAVTAKEISFSGEAGKISRGTRANGDKTGEAAASLLNNNFIVFGCKTTNETPQTVYDHYNVNWINNDTKWEYIGQTKNALNETATNQTIKYWDYSATDYKFVAFSLGEATQGTDVTITKVDASATNYTLTGTAANLSKCYVADRITAKLEPATGSNEVKYGQPVSFKFHSLGTKVNIGLYETISGYSINSVKFYESNTGDVTPSETPTLFASNATIPTDNNAKKKSAKITFGNDNKVIVTWEEEEEVTKAAVTKDSKITFENLPKVDQESAETTGKNYLSRTKDNCIAASANAVIPCNTIGALTLKIDYTLIAIDGSGETIEVKGATATIPESQTKWESNKIYTYLFKISDNTNGSTGGGTVGLSPITFEAIVTDIAGNEHENDVSKSTANGQ